MGRSVAGFIEHKDGLIAGALAYKCLLALFPFLVFLSALKGLYGEVPELRQAVWELMRMLPSEVAATIEPVVEEVMTIREGGLLTLGLLGTVWVLMLAVDTFRDALNMIIRAKERRPLMHRLLQSLGFVLALVVSLFVVSFAIVLGPVAYDVAIHWLGAPEEMVWLWNLLRYTVAMIVLVQTLRLVYFFLPAAHLRWRDTREGGLVAAVLWVLLASLFSLYLSQAGDYSITYGSLAGVIISMLFFQFSAMIFLFGAEVVSAVRQEHETSKDEEGA